MPSLSSLIGGSVPIGSIVQGQFANDPTFLPCDGSDQIAANYPMLDKTGLATFGGNTAAQRGLTQTVYWGLTAYGNGNFVVLPYGGGGTANYCCTSTDGISWAQRSLPATAAWAGVMFANGMFIAWGGSYIITSTDGITWTIRSASVSVPTYGHMAYSGSMFVMPAAGPTNAYYTSPDGITWTTRANLPASVIPTAISYAGGRFWLTFNDNSAIVYTSFDGLNWTQTPVPVGSPGPYRYFNVGSAVYSGAGARSYDNGNSWIADSSIAGAYMAYGGLLVSMYGYVKPDGTGGGWRLPPGMPNGFTQFSGTIANNRLVASNPGSAVYIFTLDFDTSKFRTPIIPKVTDGDRYYIKAK